MTGLVPIQLSAAPGRPRTRTRMRFLRSPPHCRRTGACVLVVHHSGKNADSGARGSTAFEAAADSVFRLKAEEGRARLQCTKQKNMVGDFSARFDPVEQGASVVLRWHPHVGTASRRARSTLSTRERVIQLALDAGSEGITASDVAEITRKGSSTVYRYLTEGVEDGRLVNTHGRYGPTPNRLANVIPADRDERATRAPSWCLTTHRYRRVPAPRTSRVEGRR